MVWRLGARVHALLHGLFKPSEAELVRQHWSEVIGLYRELGIADASGREHLIAALADTVQARLDIPAEHEQAALAHAFNAEMFNYEGLFQLPVIDWSETRTIAELWDIREELTRQRGFAADFEANCERLEAAFAAMLEPLYSACPALLDHVDEIDGITVPTHLLQSIGNLGTATQAMLGVPFAEELAERGLLARLSDRLERNLVAASGGNPADPRGFNRAPKLPEQFDAKSPDQLVATYLGGTPLLPLFNQTLNFTIPTKARFEHHHIVAGSGHGKTQTLQYLIANDLEAVVDGKRLDFGFNRLHRHIPPHRNRRDEQDRSPVRAVVTHVEPYREHPRPLHPAKLAPGPGEPGLAQQGREGLHDLFERDPRTHAAVRAPAEDQLRAIRIVAQG